MVVGGGNRGVGSKAGTRNARNVGGDKRTGETEGNVSGGRRGGSRGASRGGLTGTRVGQIRTTIPEALEDPGNDSFFDDPGHGEKLQARNGCLGTISSRGWEAKTNFLIDVYALINSSTVYKLKGI